jgi:hypothetical protein
MEGESYSIGTIASCGTATKIPAAYGYLYSEYAGLIADE